MWVSSGGWGLITVQGGRCYKTMHHWRGPWCPHGPFENILIYVLLTTDGSNPEKVLVSPIAWLIKCKEMEQIIVMYSNSHKTENKQVSNPCD